MSANMDLQPGILALIIGGVHTAQNTGKIVTLLRFVRTDEMIEEFGVKAADDLWIISGEDLVVCHNVLGHNRYFTHNIGAAGARFLMPIRPEEDDTVHESEKELEYGKY